MKAADKIQRFIRLTNLIPELLDMVDEKKDLLSIPLWSCPIWTKANSGIF